MSRKEQIAGLVRHVIKREPEVCVRFYLELLGAEGEPLTSRQQAYLYELLRRENELISMRWKVETINAVINFLNDEEVVRNKTISEDAAQWLLGVKIERKEQ